MDKLIQDTNQADELPIPIQDSTCSRRPMRNERLTFCGLPIEVLMYIGLLLPCREFGRLLQTNHYIHDVLNTHYIWHQRFTSRFGQQILETKLRAPTSPFINDIEPSQSAPLSSSPGSPWNMASSPAFPSSLDYVHNNQDPVESLTTSSPHMDVDMSSNQGDDESNDEDEDEDDNDDALSSSSKGSAVSVNKNKGKDREIDLRKTTSISKERLIELYKQYSRMTIPAEDMSICHMGDRYWTMVESRRSAFGKLAQLKSVWWMDIAAVFYGVPPGRYKAQWRIKLTSDAPVINSEFRAIVFNEDIAEAEDQTETILFKPRNTQQFTDHTDTQSSKVRRKPFKRAFEGFLIMELPGEIVIDESRQGIFLQIRNHEGWKSGLSVDYARLVDLDDPDRYINPELEGRQNTSDESEETNDDGEEYYPSSSSSSVRPTPWLNPLTYRSRGHRQYNSVNSSVPLDVGARTPPLASVSGSGSQSGSGSGSGPEQNSSGNNNNGSGRVGSDGCAAM
ncbi:hypothetical protein BG011_004258 [Mortierella polycephala]|uniref:F-box domain-containing protein n=1 Tax=Mortierella polycephala TaxID=41804 RepID=A0A9P6QCZ9_9FUNG|nr:hypothetical protein BG011_004258 [Mortierella polycephala]